MGEPAVTYSFTNGAGNYVDADEVNQNYTDVLNAIKSASTADIGCGSLKIAGETLASYTASAVAAYDPISYATGTFTATVSGCSGSNTLQVKYEKIKNLIKLHVPAFSCASDGSADFQLDGVPAAIRPAITEDMALSVPTGNFLPDNIPTHFPCPYFPVAVSGSIYIHNEDGYWNTTGPKGFSKSMVVVYSLT
jgi:hypothetical protein